MPPDTATDAAAATTAPSNDRWFAVLETLESRLYYYEEFLNGRGDVPPYELPVGLGPIPRELQPRARMVLEGQLDLENRFRDRMGALRAMLDRPGDPPPALSLYLDQRG